MALYRSLGGCSFNIQCHQTLREVEVSSHRHHPHPRLHLRNFHLQHVECNICGCKCLQSHGSDGKYHGSICVATLDSQYSLYSNVDTFLTFDKDSLFLVFWFFMGLETVETVEIRLAVFAVNCTFLARGKIWANSLFF